MRFAIFSIVLLGFLVFGCTQPTPTPVPTLIPTPVIEQPTAEPTLEPTLAPTVEPTVELKKGFFSVLSPLNESSVPGPVVFVKINSSFSMGKIDGVPAPNQGHFCLYLDGGDCIRTATLDYPIGRVSVGPHSLKVQLLNNDRSPFTDSRGSVDSNSLQQIDFTVTAPPLFQIREPLVGSTAIGPDVRIILFSSRVKIGPIGLGKVDGEGHFCLYLDENPCVELQGFEHIYKNLLGGKHVLKVQLLNNDKTPIKLSSGETNSDSIVTQDFYVKLPDAFLIKSPSNGSTLTGSTVGILLDSSRFKMGQITGKNVAGEGHFCFYLDGGDCLRSANFEYALTNLLPGKHSLHIQLLNNDATPILTKDGMVDESTVKDLTFAIQLPTPTPTQVASQTSNPTSAYATSNPVTIALSSVCSFLGIKC